MELYLRSHCMHDNSAFYLDVQNFHSLKLQYELLRASASYRQLNHLPAVCHVTFTYFHTSSFGFSWQYQSNERSAQCPRSRGVASVIRDVQLIWLLSWSTPTILASLLHSHTDCDVRVWMLFTSSSTVEWSHSRQVVHSGLRYDINLPRNNSVSVFQFISM